MTANNTSRVTVWWRSFFTIICLFAGSANISTKHYKDLFIKSQATFSSILRSLWLNCFVIIYLNNVRYNLGVQPEVCKYLWLTGWDVIVDSVSELEAYIHCGVAKCQLQFELLFRHCHGGRSVRLVNKRNASLLSCETWKVGFMSAWYVILGSQSSHIFTGASDCCIMSYI